MVNRAAISDRSSTPGGRIPITNVAGGHAIEGEKRRILLAEQKVAVNRRVELRLTHSSTPLVPFRMVCCELDRTEKAKGTRRRNRHR